MNDSAFRDRLNHLEHTVQDLEAHRRQHDRELGQLVEDTSKLSRAAAEMKRVAQNFTSTISEVKYEYHKSVLRIERIELMLEQLCLGLSITPPARIK